MKKVQLAVFCLLTLPLLAACRDSQPVSGADASRSRFDYGQPEGMNRAEYVAYLKEKAESLAEGELARLAAIELVYRNKTYYHGLNRMGGGSTVGVYTKLYRQFTDYTLVDIQHSDSVIQPLLFTYDFTYDLIGTEPVLVDRPSIESARAARANQNFRFQRTDTVERVYVCDENGELLGEPASPLPRPNYWDREGNSAEEFWLEEPHIPL